MICYNSRKEEQCEALHGGLFRKFSSHSRPPGPAPQGRFSIRVDKSLFGARARSAVGELSEDLPGMAREVPARAMRLGPSPRAVRHPPRCALDVYTRHGLWWLPRGNDMRQIVPDHSVCSLQGRAAEQRPRCLSHAPHRWTTSIHGASFGTGCPCVLLSTIPIAIIRDCPSFCV